MTSEDEKAVWGVKKTAEDTVLKAERRDPEEEQEKGWDEEESVRFKAGRKAQEEKQRKDEGHRKLQAAKERQPKQERLVQAAITFFFLFFLWCGLRFGYSPEA